MPIDPLKIKKIAVISPRKPFFGATLVQIPFHLLLRKTFPNAKIKIWSLAPHTKIFQTNGFIDELSLCKNSTQPLKEVLRFKPDMLINFRHLSEISHIIAMLSRAKYKLGVTVANMQKSIYTHTVDNDTGLYRGLLYLKLLETFLEKNQIPYPKEADERFVAFKEIDTAYASEAVLHEATNQVCMLIGGGEGEHKRWGIQNFVALAKLIKEKKPSSNFIFIIGSAEDSDMPYLEENLNKEDFQVFRNASLKEIMSLMKRCNVVVANDCGPSHIAQMLETNYVGVWGWNNQHPILRMAEWSLYRNNSTNVVAPYLQDIKSLPASRVFEFVSPFLK